MTTTHIPRTTGHEEWITVREACALIGVSPATLRRWSNAGKIRTFTTPGGHRRFPRSAVLGLLPAAGRQRPNLQRLGESPARLSHVYRRHLAAAGHGVSWIGDLDDDESKILRDHGRRIACSLIGFIDAATPEERERVIGDASVAAAEYGRIAARRNAGMRPAVEAFLRFRMPFVRELGAVARRRGLEMAETIAVLEAATEAIDLLLGALMSGHDAEAAEPSPCKVAAR